MTDKYERSRIPVLCRGLQGGFKIIWCKVDQMYFVSPQDKTNISFERRDVKPIFIKGLIFSKWVNGVEWKVGDSKALHPNEEGEFLPVLSLGDTKKFIEKQVFDASNSDKKVMKDWQFVVLILLVVAVLSISIISLFGFHLSGSTQTIHTVISSTPTPSIAIP